MSKQADASRLTYEPSGARAVRPTSLGRGTQGVPDVRRTVESQFQVAFPHRVWVAGQVVLPLGDDDGTLRFSLAAPSDDEPFVLPCAVPAESLSAVRDLLSRTHDAALVDVVREGRLARVGGLLRYDALRNAVVLLVSELDPTPTAAELADARVAVLEQVRDAELSARQRRLAVAQAPLDVAVVGGKADATLAAVEQVLTGSGYGVRVRVLAVDVSGVDAGEQVAGAVRAAGADNDVVLVVREQGRPLGLASYDALEAAQAVADAPVPVVAGLGGGGTVTAVDEVAHTSLPTAGDAARWVVDRLAEAEDGLEQLADQVGTAAEAAAQRCRDALAEVTASVRAAGEAATPRAAAARSRARLRLRVVCVLLAVLAGVAAVAFGEPLLLLLLLVPVVALGGVELWWSRGGSRGDRRMGQRDDEFVQVVQRLAQVRDELTTTSSPERVASLRSQADGLVLRGRELLGRHVPAPGEEVPPAVEAPAAEAVPGSSDGSSGAAPATSASARPLPDEAVALVEGGASGGYVPPAPVPGASPADAGWVQPDAVTPDPPDESGSTRVRSSS